MTIKSSDADMAASRNEQSRPMMSPMPKAVAAI